MKSALPKVLHQIGGRPMLGHVLAVARALGAARIVVVTAPDADARRRARQANGVPRPSSRIASSAPVTPCSPPVAALGDFAGNVLVLFGDAPLLDRARSAGWSRALNRARDIAALGFRAADPTGYGRMIVEGDALVRIVEQKDASPEERKHHARALPACWRAGRAHGVRPSSQGREPERPRRILSHRSHRHRARPRAQCAVGRGPGERDAGRQFPCATGRSRSRLPGAAPARADGAGRHASSRPTRSFSRPTP